MSLISGKNGLHVPNRRGFSDYTAILLEIENIPILDSGIHK